MNEEKPQLKVGLLLNYLNLLLSSFIPLLYTPIMLRILGQEEYGLYKLSGSITSYLSLIAFGLGAAITRYLIKARIEKLLDEPSVGVKGQSNLVKFLAYLFEYSRLLHH